MLGLNGTNTTCASHDASAAELEALPSIDSVHVVRAGDGGRFSGYGYAWSVYFDGAAALGQDARRVRRLPGQPAPEKKKTRGVGRSGN